MKTQNGSTLVIALVLLSMISLVAVYALESSNIQTKMVNNSLFSTLTYQECRNEQEAQLRDINESNSVLRDSLTDTANLDTTIAPLVEEAHTPKRDDYKPKSTSIETTWSYLGKDGSIFDGSSLGTFTSLVFQNTCNAQFRFSSNTQVMGVAVRALSNSATVN
jgi:type II secretory pathway pseudopilin PulG